MSVRGTVIRHRKNIYLGIGKPEFSLLVFYYFFLILEKLLCLSCLIYEREVHFNDLWSFLPLFSHHKVMLYADSHHTHVLKPLLILRVPILPIFSLSKLSISQLFFEFLCHWACLKCSSETQYGSKRQMAKVKHNVKTLPRVNLLGQVSLHCCHTLVNWTNQTLRAHKLLLTALITVNSSGCKKLQSHVH